MKNKLSKRANTGERLFTAMCQKQSIQNAAEQTGGSHKPKIFVAMSGGVDSSVSAALLKKEGYDVIGVFMSAWRADFLECARGDDRREAMRAAAHLKIPFLTFDIEKEYKKEVVNYMIAEYRAGRTPNPDVMCNKHIKFGLFLKRAREMGADYIATGHYAQIVRCKAQSVKHKNVTRYTLHASRDKNKDQSYFLWTLTQEQLRYTLFPVGAYTKPEVREMARKFGLPNAERKESQGVCFVGEFNMKDFLKHYLKEKKGAVLNEKGEIIGSHDGVFFYTLGERHGFMIVEKTHHDSPYYVVRKDVKKNTITVSHEKNQDRSSTKEVRIKNPNFISGSAPDLKKKYTARVRYRQPLQNSTIKIQKSKTIVLFEKSQIAAPGQSLVLYGEEGCLGGGIIV